MATNLKVLVLVVLLGRPEAPNLHDGFARPLAHDDALVIPMRDLPDLLCRRAEVPYVFARVRVVQTHEAIVAASDKEVRVELKRRDARIMCCNPLASVVVRRFGRNEGRGGGRELEDDNSSVRTARREGGICKLELAYECSMAL